MYVQSNSDSQNMSSLLLAGIAWDRALLLLKEVIEKLKLLKMGCLIEPKFGYTFDEVSKMWQLLILTLNGTENDLKWQL